MRSGIAIQKPRRAFVAELWAERRAGDAKRQAKENQMTTDHEMRMYALKLFEILQAVDHTLTVHGHVDCGTPLHRRISDAIAIPNEDPSGQRREATDIGWMGDIGGNPFGPSDR